MSATPTTATPNRLRRALVTLAILLPGIAVAVHFWSYRWLSRARGKIDRGAVADADRDLRRFLRLHPDHPEANLLLGLVWGHRRRWHEAIEQFRRVPDDRPEAIEARWREGDASFMANRFGDSERALGRALDIDPNHGEVLQVLMQLYRWQDREWDARQLVWSSYERVPQPRRVALLAEWFRVRFAQFSSQATAERLRASLQAQPDDIESTVALARWHYRERDLAGAIQMADRALAQHPHLGARSLLISCLLEQGDGARARRALDEWPDTARDDRYWPLEARWQQEHGGDYRAAAENWLRALADRPDDWESRYRLATCLRRLERPADAEREAAEALRIRDAASHAAVKDLLDTALPQLAQPDNRHRLGAFYESIGYAREAACWYEQALIVDPEHPASTAGLERLRAASARR